MSKDGLYILGGLLAVLGLASRSKSRSLGSSNDEETGLMRMAPADRIRELARREQADPFLGQFDGRPVRYRGNQIQRPEYILVLDLVDSELQPLPDYLYTTPDRPYGPRDMGALRTAFGMNPNAILRTLPIGFISSKAQFFAMVEMISPFVIGHGDDVIDIFSQDQMNRNPNMLGDISNEFDYTGIARFSEAFHDMQARTGQKRYAMQLVAGPCINGRPVMDSVLPFSPLMHRFDLYGDRRFAENDYDNTVNLLEQFIANNAGSGMRMANNSERNALARMKPGGGAARPNRNTRPNFPRGGGGGFGRGGFGRGGFNTDSGNDAVLRPANVNDLNQILNLALESLIPGGNYRPGERNFVSNILNDCIGNGACAVLERNGQVVGFVAGYPENITEDYMVTSGNVRDDNYERYSGLNGFKGFMLVVSPAYRGQGLGIALMDWIQDYGRSNGYDYIWLGSEDRLNNRNQWATRTDIVSTGGYNFFAKML